MYAVLAGLICTRSTFAKVNVKIKVALFMTHGVYRNQNLN